MSFKTSTCREGRRAFSILEILVVVSIVGLLFALAAPAILAARASSLRAACCNKLHQIGVAMHGYFDVHGMIALGNPAPSLHLGSSNFAPHARLLPYLGAEAVYDGVNFGVPIYSSKFATGSIHATVRRTRLHAFLCPADGGNRTYPAATNYRVNRGVNLTQTQYLNQTGAFQFVHATRDAAVLDGLSHTAGWSEKLVGDGDARRFNIERDWVDATGNGIVGPTDAVGELIELCSGRLPPNPLHHSDAGATWFEWGSRYTTYTHDVTPNSRTPDCGFSPFTPPPGFFAARSQHGGGVQVVMMDGSCRFVENSIDLRRWRAMGTRSDGD